MLVSQLYFNHISNHSAYLHVTLANKNPLQSSDPLKRENQNKMIIIIIFLINKITVQPKTR
uniref:Uncharacterized protein n=1 Tax=Anguilla anguilla TaxID=7936 RepID=A0A0E9QX94_ANGAN